MRTWGPNLMGCSARWGRRLDTIDTMTSSIRKAGFVDIHEVEYKWPIGPWPKDQQLKEAGTVNYQHWMSGVEGWCMWLLTKFGEPQPWTREEVDVYVSKMRAQLKNPRHHVYQRAYDLHVGGQGTKLTINTVLGVECGHASPFRGRRSLSWLRRGLVSRNRLEHRARLEKHIYLGTDTESRMSMQVNQFVSVIKTNHRGIRIIFS